MLSGEWRIRKNNELETFFYKPDKVETIKNKRLQWASHAWYSQNTLIHIVLQENTTGKRPLEDSDVVKVKKDVEALGGGLDS